MQKPTLNLHQSLHFITKKHIFFAIYLLLLLALIQLHHQHKKSLISHEVVRTKEEDGSAGRANNNNKCDFSKGRWIRNKAKPIYNGTSCGTIKKGQNCMVNGRPDTGYLHWRWQPAVCDLHPFHPSLFLTLIKNKHLAFIGDSLARNQLESLMCLLSTVSQPELIHSSGDIDNKFRRWAFPSHNATVSVFWSPLLVKHVEKEPSLGKNHNKLYMDSVDERWARELDQIDIVVFSAGHWFLLPAIYYDSAGGAVLGCHYCPEFNHTEIGFFDIFRKSLRIALNEVKRGRRRSEKLVVLTTFSPAHFEGEWNKAGACSKMEPFKEGEKKMEYMDGEMRRIGVEEVRRGNDDDEEEEEEKNGRVKYEVVDVTELALMRGDGHPGAYMNPFPYAQGYKERLQNDCVHWCLPGPVDTWNEILLEIIKTWK